MSEEPMVVPSAPPQMITAPKFCASGFNITTTATEVIILCSSLMPGALPTGEIVNGLRPEVVLSLSPQAAKELLVVLQGLMPNLEKDVGGEISTPWLREHGKK